MSRQQQPFRFWFPYWGNPTPAPTQRPAAPPPQRTLSRVPTSAPSRPPTAPGGAPSQPQPTTSRRASQPSPASSPLPSPSRRSPRSQPADQRAAAAQRPSPSRPASKPPSPSRPTATKAESQPSQPPMQGDTQVQPSTPPPPSVSQSEATANQFPPESQKPPNSTNGKGSRISISSTPWSSSSHGERASFQKEIKEGLSKLVQKLSTGQAGPTGSDQSVSIITLAGQNKGATMFIGNGFDQKQRENKLIRVTSDEERSKDTSNNDSAIAASVNSNVQSINNSVLNESSCEERNPGVHLILSTKPTEPVSLRGRMEPLKPQKTASNLTTPQKLTYEPNIRRRCLRGLFMEPSEDDQEDPQKPQRHGCRVSCDDKKKGKANDEEGTSKPNGNGNS